MIDILLAAALAAEEPSSAKRAETTEKNAWDRAFEGASVFGTLRAAWINNNASLNNPDTTATALGGRFGFETAPVYGAKLRVAAYTSQMLPLINPSRGSAELNGDYFTNDMNSFTYLGEAALMYEREGLFIQGGRIRVDTPYADTDDLRMAPNTFEGAAAAYKLNDMFSFTAAYLNRWAGFDSAGPGASQEVFKPLVRGDAFGAVATAVDFTYSEKLAASVWYYNIDKAAQIVYVEADGNVDLVEELKLEYAFQASSINQLSQSAVEGKIAGAAGVLRYGGFSLGGAYNHADQRDLDVITDGFGGGPYFTSMDEATIAAVSEAAPGEDIRAFTAAVGYEIQSGLFEGLGFEAAHGQFTSQNDTSRVFEDDLIAAYTLGDHWDTHLVYTHYNDRSDANARFDRVYLHIDYNF